MAHTILIPTDLTVASLNTLKLSLAQAGDTRMRVILMHGQLTGSSITDLLFHDPKRTLEKLLTPEFRDALAIVRNRFEDRLGGVDIHLFHGRSTAAFEQFAGAHGVQAVHLHRGYKLRLRGTAFDPTPLIRRSSLPVVEVGVNAILPEFGHDNLQVLFTP